MTCWCESSLCGCSVHTHGYFQCSALLNPFSSGGTKNKDQESCCRASDNLCWHDFQKAMIIPAYSRCLSTKPWNFGWLLICISPQGDITTWAIYKTIPWSGLQVQGRDRVKSKAQRQGWDLSHVCAIMCPTAWFSPEPPQPTGMDSVRDFQSKLNSQSLFT